MMPDFYKAFLQDILRQRLIPQQAFAQGKQAWGSKVVQLPEGGCITSPAALKQFVQ
jgi:hypothetical protein